jgi:hypothetical protein
MVSADASRAMLSRYRSLCWFRCRYTAAHPLSPT